MPIFTTPSVEEGPLGYGPLLSRYKLGRGITVLKKNGVYTQHRYPQDSECAAADIAYIGGHQYVVSDAEAAALLAAGYATTATPTQSAPTGDGTYGGGSFGDGPYGG